MNEVRRDHPLLLALRAQSAPKTLQDEASLLPSQSLSQWLEAIDDSPYALKEWAEALIEFQTWLLKNEQIKNLEDMLEYLSCCVEGARAGPKLPLTFLLKEYLDKYGAEPGSTRP